MIRLVILTTFFLGFSIVSFAQMGSIEGVITDKENGTTLPYANIVLKQGSSQIAGTTTDLDGAFELKAIPPGEYSLIVSYTSYGTLTLNGIKVYANRSKLISKDVLALKSTVTNLGPVDITVEKDYEQDLIDMGGITVAGLDEEQIMKSPGTDISRMLTTLPRMIGNDNGSDAIFANGQRPDAGYYIVDGRKVRTLDGIPRSSISSMEAMMGGIPAAYGDATGAIVTVTTKASSTKFQGSIEHITSGAKIGDRYAGLDPYGFNQTEFSLSGPLLVQKKEGKPNRTLLGFFISGNVNHQLDSRPSAIGAWKVKDEALERLKLDPLRQGFSENSVIPNTDYLRLDDFERVKVRPNTQRLQKNLTAKINVATTDHTTLTFGGNYGDNLGNRYDFDHSLFDYESYASEISRNWGVYGQFTHRFNKDKSDVTQLIDNAYYTLQIDYGQEYFKRENSRFGDDFFQYGYIGKFTTRQGADFELGADSTTGIIGSVQQTFRDTLITFEPGNANPTLARYTERYYELNGWKGFDAEGNPIYDPARIEALANYNNIQSGGGLINGDNLEGRSRSVYGMWITNGDATNAQGGNTDNYSEFQAHQVRFTGQGGSDIGKHSIMLGFEYEQRIERGYSLNPRSLWTIARQRANSHIDQIDFESAQIEYPGPVITYDRLNASPGEYSGNDQQSFIDYNMRKVMGLDPDGVDFLDVNSIDPSLYRIEYFAADELYNGGNSLVNYYGYDPYGNKTSRVSSFNDFFTKRDDQDNALRPIDAFKPIYYAGYIEDQFKFRNINLRAGIRVDQYDANQQVLIDPYVLFPTVKAGEAQTLELLEEGRTDHPENIGNDYVVYVDNVQNPSTILGYRDGSTWYSASGAELKDASSLRVSNGLPAPLLVDKENTSSTDITSESFRDYKPLTNIMPRVAFNFPISDVAKFYASYDVLTKRPTVGNRLDPSDYYFLESRAGSAQLNNPNLRPERTTSYEVGFEQKLTYNSALRVNVFYSESRDMVQAVRVFDAYPIEYQTFENIDISTVKGLTVGYDYRTKKNVTLRAFYTLQFAEGTGSSATSQLNLARTGEPNLRAPIRLAFDQRHQITANIDYRISDRKWVVDHFVKENPYLKNTGVNLQVRGGSGMPYNPQSNFTSDALFANNPAPLQDGTINSASMPWKFRFDLGVDKTFMLSRADSNKAPYSLVVTCQVLNLLNSRTLNNVYRATGNPDDDGYLNSPIGKNNLQNQNSDASFTEYYAMKLMNPNNWELPRRLQVGVRMLF